MSPIRERSPSAASVQNASTLGNPVNFPACQNCKQKKKRCDRVRPVCSYCTRTGHACDYERPPSENGTKSSHLMEQIMAQKMEIARLQKQVDHLSQQQHQTLAQQYQQALPIRTPLPIPGHPTPLISPSPLHSARSPSYSSPFTPTNAERIVIQLVNAEIDLGNAAQSLVGSVAQQLAIPWKEIVDQTSGPRLLHAPNPPTLASLPSKDMAEMMVDRFFNYTDSFQPLLDPEWVRDGMVRLYPSNPEIPSLLASPPTSPNLEVFWMFMIFAIGYNLLPCSTTDGNCDGGELRRCATAHFISALRGDDITCLTGIALYCALSMTDPSFMDPYQTVQFAAKLAVELGFHKDDVSLSLADRSRRQRVFYSIFGMDRDISFALGRPTAIPEHLIENPLPQSVPDLPTIHTAYMSSLELFHHVILLRHLQGIVLSDVYLSPRPGEDPEDASSRIRNEIDTWFENLPRKGEGYSARPHPYLEVNYHLLLTRLYSPSPLIRQTNPGRMSTLRESAYRVIEMYGSVQDEHRVQRNHITLSHLASACTALVYTISERECVPANFKLVSWRRQAVSQLESAENLFAQFCSQSVHSEIYSNAFTKLTSSLKAKLLDRPPEVVRPRWASRTSGTDATTLPGSSQTSISPQTPLIHGLETQFHGAILSTATNGSMTLNQVRDQPTPFQWDAWLAQTPPTSSVLVGTQLPSQGTNVAAAGNGNGNTPGGSGMTPFLTDFGLRNFAT